MQYALALVGAALASVATANEHHHGHAHFHAERAAEAEAQGHILQDSDFVQHTTVVTEQSVTTTMVAAQGWAASSSTSAPVVTAAAAPVKAQSSSKQTSFATSAKSSAAASTQTASSGGSGGAATVRIINKCKQPLWINQGWDDAVSYAPGSTYSVPVAGESIALKMGFSKGAQWEAQIAQVEYDLTGKAGYPVSYDLSMIKGNPLGPYGMTLEMADSSCQSLTCAPGITARSSACPAYFVEADNPVPGLSHSCSISSMTFTACSG